jgi:hypothetical protein
MAQLLRHRSLSIAGVLLAASALALNACGGPDEGRPVVPDPFAGESVDPCVGHEDLEFLMIQDFEENVARGFNVGNDGNNLDNVDGQILPFEESDPITQPIPDEPRCGVSTRALRYQAEGICQWASISANLDTLNDASEWEGIALWVRQTPEPEVAEPVGRGIRVGIRDLFTVESTGADEKYCGSAATEENPEANRETPAADRSTCPPSAPCPTLAEVGADHPEKLCCDPFGLSVGLTEDWHLWAVPFAEMQQGGYGRVRLEGLQTSRLVRLELALGPGNYDFWIDDVAFYRRRVGSGGEAGSGSN